MLRNRDLINSCRARTCLYIIFLLLTVIYFTSELCVHVLFPPTEWSGLDTSEAMALKIGIHEGFEFLVLGLAFFLYRAKIND
jgi:hypothetical protein